MANKIKTIDELEKVIIEDTHKFADKLGGENHLRHIVICGGTGCLSSNSKQILQAFEREIEERNLSYKVTVNIVGCFGFCSQGPFVKIYPEDTLYRMVKVNDVKRIMDIDICGGQIVEDLVYEDPNTKVKHPRQDDIPFYHKQMRIALHGCGIINPENVHEALGYDALKGLVRALNMDRQAVIDEISLSGLRGRGGGGFPTGKNGNLLMIKKIIQNMSFVMVMRETRVPLWIVQF